MYKSFYQLHSKPFSLLPDSEFLYLGSTHRTAYSLLEYGLLTEAPFMVLTGDPGMGKTSLLQKLIADTRDAFSIGFLTNARYDVDHLLPWILFALGLNNKQVDPVEAQHLFANFLAQERARHRRVVLIMDEAQNLGVKLLEELRLLSNLNQEKTLQLQIILSGQPDLQTLLRRVDMTQFAQRVVVDYHLQPFTEEEVAHYIRHRIQLAGSTQPLFSAPACALTYRLSQGNPRLINQVCEMALTYGYAQQATRITAKLLAQAALDRRKNRILPLAELDDLEELAAGKDAEEPDAQESIAQSLPSRESPPQIESQQPVGAAEPYYQRGMTLRKSQDYIAAIAGLPPSGVWTDRALLPGAWSCPPGRGGISKGLHGLQRAAHAKFKRTLSVGANPGAVGRKTGGPRAISADFPYRPDFQGHGRSPLKSGRGSDPRGKPAGYPLLGIRTSLETRPAVVEGKQLITEPFRRRQSLP